MNTIARVRSVFPLPSKRLTTGRRGMGQEFAPWADNPVVQAGASIGNLLYDAATGSLDLAQVQGIDNQNATDIKRAATNQITGTLNQDLANQETQQMVNDVNSVITQSNLTSTGSVIADLWDTTLGTGPGVIPSLSAWWNRNVAPPGPSNPSNLLLYAVIAALAGGAIYFVVRD